jgi:hypothetical protein
MMDSKEADERFQAAIKEIRRGYTRWWLLSIPACLMLLVYLGLLVCSCAGYNPRNWGVEFTTAILGLTLLSVILASVGMHLMRQWSCPACGTSFGLAPFLSRRPLRWWMVLPGVPRECLVCGVSFRQPDRTSAGS